MQTQKHNRDIVIENNRIFGIQMYNDSKNIDI